MEKHFRLNNCMDLVEKYEISVNNKFYHLPEVVKDDAMVKNNVYIPTKSLVFSFVCWYVVTEFCVLLFKKLLEAWHTTFLALLAELTSNHRL